MRKALTIILMLFCSTSICLAKPQTKTTPKAPTHALIKLAVKAPFTGAKGLLYGAMFATESGVDVVHGGLALADKAFDALSIQGKVPVLDVIYKGVSVGADDTAKLDSWLERQEQGLFGTHN